MQEPVAETKWKIDRKTWERRAIFDFFRNFSEPYHGVFLRVDCTGPFRYAQEHRLSISLSLLHRSLVATHHVENFRTRIVDGEIWL